ncbi:MAG: amidohydrolase family protein, partial [Clostridia bacterium]|nr:amidohydrolase family protein [Clostridia bacterium]
DSGQNLLERLRDEKEREKMKEWGRAKWQDDLSWVLVARCKAYPQYEGLWVPEAAKLHGKDVYDTIYDMILDSENACSCCYFTMCEEDVETVMAHPREMVCTDSCVAGTRTVYHPRMRGSFPRALGRYVRERGVVTLPEMIRKMTSMPAAVYGLSTKGMIKEGMDADICIFDADKIIDRSEFTDCTKGAEGLNYVILGGEVVCENAVFNGKRNGKLIERT